MELPPVLSAGDIGAKKRFESRPAVGEGITMFGSLPVISAEAGLLVRIVHQRPICTQYQTGNLWNLMKY